MKHAFMWVTALLALAAGYVLLSFQAPETRNGESMSATYSRGILHATIPFVALHPGAGQLTVEVLDPEDQSLSRISQRLDIESAKGTWQVDLRFAKAIETDDLVWDRLRFRFVYSS